LTERRRNGKRGALGVAPEVHVAAHRPVNDVGTLPLCVGSRLTERRDGRDDEAAIRPREALASQSELG
jgi:hypothetical protein